MRTRNTNRGKTSACALPTIEEIKDWETKV